MSVDEQKINDYIKKQEDEWELLDKEAEICEQAVFEEVAAAKVERAKMEAKTKARLEAQEKADAEEAERAEKAAKMAADEADLTEEEVIKRRAIIAARDGVRLRRTLRMAIFFTALGVVEAVFGFYFGKTAFGAVGVGLTVLAGAYAFSVRPRHKAAVECFNVLNAELEEYYVKHPEAKEAVEGAAGEN